MGLNDNFLSRMKEKIESAKEGAQVGDELQEESIEIENQPIEAENAPDTNAELEALRKEIAELKTAKPVEPEASSKPEQQAVEDEIQFYESPDERESLVDLLGEDAVKAQEQMIARALKTQGKITQKKLTELEKRNSELEQATTSAEFVRAVGVGNLKVFNDPKFQAIAKGQETGYKRTLFDELKQIVEGSDIEGAEYVKQQIEKYKTGDNAVRKAQVSAGRSPASASQEQPVYDPDKAKELIAATRRHRPGSSEFIKADEKARAYMKLAI